MRILIVEDDPDLSKALADTLRDQNYASDRASNAGDARLLIDAGTYAAAIIDLGLPDESGISVVRHLRGRGDVTPVILLTARSGTADKVNGLDAGADDYLTKPFDPDELMARLRALVRRGGAFLGPETTIGNVRFDMRNFQLFVEGRPVVLAQREGELLRLLLGRVGTVVTRRLVEDQLYGMEQLLGSNAIDVHVHRLRQKLEAVEAEVSILTIRGVGYLLKGR